MNDNGCSHMHLNILVLQQNLKNVEPSARLEYSALFFDLFTEGAEKIVARAKECGRDFGVPGGRFTEATVKGLLELVFGERMRDERREVGVQAKRQLDAMVLELSEFMY